MHRFNAFVPRRFLRDERGGIAIIACAFFMVGIACAALAVDAGSLYLEKRKAQGIADLAAMAAAGDLAHAQAAARATLIANKMNMGETTLTVELGHYEANASKAVAARFSIGALPINAARVTVTKPGRIYFAKSIANDCCQMTVTALAANAQLATFSLGTRLAALREGVVNNLLGGLLGGNVNLSLVDYNAIASANVGLLQFGKALATQLHLTGVSYNDVLSANASVGDVLSALIAVTPSASAQVALKKILNQSSAATVRVPLPSMVSFGPLGYLGVSDPVTGVDPQFNIMDIVNAATTISGNGKLLNLDLGATIPGVASLKLDVAIGQPAQQSPWAAVGQAGAKVHTAQIRARLVAEIGGTGLLAATRVRLPIFISGAYADGQLSNIACAANGTGSVSVSAKPGIAYAAIGEVSNADLTDFSSNPVPAKATMVDLLLIKVQGRTNPAVEVTNTSASTLTFSQADIDNKTVKRVLTRNIVETLVTSTVGNLDLELGPLTTNAVKPLINGLLSAVLAPLDQVVYTLLSSLGIRLGEVDVRVHGVRCGGAVLVG